MALTVRQKSSGSRGQRAMLQGGWGTTLRVCNDARCPFHLMGIFHASVCIRVCIWRQLKACGHFSQSEGRYNRWRCVSVCKSVACPAANLCHPPYQTPILHPLHDPSGPAGGCNSIIALWPYPPIYHHSATLLIHTHTPDWGQFSRSLSHHSFTFEGIG